LKSQSFGNHQILQAVHFLVVLNFSLLTAMCIFNFTKKNKKQKKKTFDAGFVFLVKTQPAFSKY